jgi:hypothetical protein
MSFENVTSPWVGCVSAALSAGVPTTKVAAGTSSANPIFSRQQKLPAFIAQAPSRLEISRTGNTLYHSRSWELNQRTVYPIPTLVLPRDYQFGDPTYSQNFRLTKAFTLKERYKFEVFGEAFNAFNIANLSSYGTVIDTLSPGFVR